MKNSQPLYNQTQIDQSASITLQWALKSIQATGGKGSAAYFHLWRGWSKSYPETTGYFIETLFDYFHLTQNVSLKKTALQCTDWLCSIQLSNGAFPNSIEEKSTPIIFDTGMILFGLIRSFEETGESKYKEALFRAVNWLEIHQDEKGIWSSHSYVPNFIPSYYTMVVWAMLKANKILATKTLNQQLSISLNYFSKKITPQLIIADWGFYPNGLAYTHTIGYTLQGMLEAALLAGNMEIPNQIKKIAEKIIIEIRKNGKLAGRYNEQWKGDFSFNCLTGQAQICILFFRLYEIFNEGQFLDEAQTLLQQTINSQCQLKVNGFYGGIPGSSPIWGKYQRFRFPNWAAKYFLDACYEGRKYAK